MEFIAVGFKYRGATPECLHQEGFINLVPEPTNPYDRNAVKVIMNEDHVGYVARDYCERVNVILAEAGRWRVELIGTYPASAKLMLHWTT